MDDDWYRSPAWSEADQDTFERRLARARSSSRAQYLLIKGQSLRKAGHRDAALGLWERALDSDEDGFETPALLECMAEAVRVEDPGRAERLLRRLLSEYPDLNNTSAMAEVTLAEILITGESEAGLREAYRLLDSWRVKRGSLFPADRYRWYLASARLAEAVGDHGAAIEAARLALALVDQPGPFAHHSAVGRVRVDPAEARRLNELVAMTVGPRQGEDGATSAALPGRMDEFAAELAADEEYQQELADWTAEDDERDAALALAEKPLTDDLRAAGLEVDSVWELGRHGVWPYSQALPVLMDHLERGGYPDLTTDAIGRALAVKEAVAYWDRLKDLYLAASSAAQEEAAAIAMSECATSAQLADLIAFVGLEDHGESRIFFLRSIRRLGRERGLAFIEDLRDHPVLGAEATAISKGRSRNG